LFEQSGVKAAATRLEATTLPAAPHPIPSTKNECPRGSLIDEAIRSVASRSTDDRPAVGRTDGVREVDRRLGRRETDTREGAHVLARDERPYRNTTSS
jgi:hypothetical protein